MTGCVPVRVQRFSLHRPPLKNYADITVYEMHHRDFSLDSVSGIQNKGKFLALTEQGTTSSSGEKTYIRAKAAQRQTRAGIDGGRSGSKSLAGGRHQRPPCLLYTSRCV